jgi:hypothetical protein
MKKIKWVAINGLFAAGIYFGFYEGIEGAKNVTMLIAWATIVMSFSYLTDAVKESFKKSERSMPASVNVIYDLAVACAFAWFGAWVTAAFWLLHLVMQEAAWDEAKKTHNAHVQGE